MDVDGDAASRVAAAIGEHARARMLYCLMDHHARTATELAVVAGVTPSTASVHLNRLRAAHLIRVHVQGRHRYYSLEGPQVAKVLEGLSVLAGHPRGQFESNAPHRLRLARTCYDHIAGLLGVLIHDRLLGLGWVAAEPDGGYFVTASGEMGLTALGVMVEDARLMRRRFAFACLDWSERRSHAGGALGAAILQMALKRRWVRQELDCRALVVTQLGRRELAGRLGVRGV